MALPGASYSVPGPGNQSRLRPPDGIGIRQGCEVVRRKGKKTKTIG